jgi:hypothetical protein
MSVTSPDYSPYYVQLDVTTDASQLADDALQNLQATYGEDWNPAEGSLAVVLIETLAPYAAVAAQNFAAMVDAAFIALCSNLWGIPYLQGSPAQTTVTLTFQDTASNYFVAAGSEFDLGAFAFTTVLDVWSANQPTVTGVQVVANDVGAEYNNLDSSDWANVTLPVWVIGLQTEAPTSDGSDPQDDTGYLSYASRELQLRGRMVVTLVDYEIVAMDTAGVGRAHAVTTAARAVTVTLTDPNGEVVPASVKTTLQSTYSTASLVNVTVTLADATYTPINVTYTVMALPGADPTVVQSSINSALTTALSPGTYGGQQGSVRNYGPPFGVDPSYNWVNDPTIRLNNLIAIATDQAGVAYVQTMTINGTAADYVMPGAVALPRPGTIGGTVNTQP